MIKIREMPNGDSMGYCEFRIKHFLKGIRPPQTKVTIEGTESHEKEVKYEREHFKFVTITQKEMEDIDKDIELAREETSEDENPLCDCFYLWSW